MPLSLVIPAAVLGLAALALLFYIVKILLSAFGLKFKSNPGSFALRRHRKMLSQAAQLLATDEARALQSLRNAFYLDRVRGGTQQADDVSEHNLRALELLVTIAERRNSRLESLSVVEELLVSRSQIVLELLDLHGSSRRISKKQRERGRTVPQWNKEEFQKRRADLTEKLFTNKESLKSKLRDLFTEVERGKSEEITYH